METQPSGGCDQCTEHSNCLLYPDGWKNLTNSEIRARILAESTQFRKMDYEFGVENAKEIDRESFPSIDIPSIPEPRNKIDSPWCECGSPLIDNRRAAGIPPESIKGKIQDFANAFNDDRVEYMINCTEGTKDWMSQATELVKVNMLINGTDTGTWLFIPAPPEDQFSRYYGIIKTETLGFQMSGPRSYLNYKCGKCTAAFKIGYTTKHCYKNGLTQTWEWDKRIDELMGIEHKPIYRPTFKNNY